MKMYIFILLISTNIHAQNQERINNSFIAFTLKEKDLIPESIAYDLKDGSFFIGSTRKGKVIKKLKNGTELDFISSKQDGLYMVIGMKIDSIRRYLWLCSSGGDNLIDYKKEHPQGRPAGLFKFDLDTGKLLKKYVLDNTKEEHFFNDLVIDAMGNVFATHMFDQPKLYIISAKTEQMVTIPLADNMKFLNGITLSDNQENLFVAHANGVGKYNLKTETWNQLNGFKRNEKSQPERIDGLYFYKNSLIAVYPDHNKVQQLLLDDSYGSIIQTIPLEINHPMMNVTTTGVLVENDFYYIANAQFDSFDKNGDLFPENKLYEPVILKLAFNQGNEK